MLLDASSCTIISATRFEAPIVLEGFTALSVEINTKIFTPNALDRSATCLVPITLFRMASAG